MKKRFRLTKPDLAFLAIASALLVGVVAFQPDDSPPPTTDVGSWTDEERHEMREPLLASAPEGHLPSEGRTAVRLVGLVEHVSDGQISVQFDAPTADLAASDPAARRGSTLSETAAWVRTGPDSRIAVKHGASWSTRTIDELERGLASGGPRLATFYWTESPEAGRDVLKRPVDEIRVLGTAHIR